MKKVTIACLICGLSVATTGFAMEQNRFNLSLKSFDAEIEFQLRQNRVNPKKMIVLERTHNARAQEAARCGLQNSPQWQNIEQKWTNLTREASHQAHAEAEQLAQQHAREQQRGWWARHTILRWALPAIAVILGGTLLAKYGKQALFKKAPVHNAKKR